jgi:hypothetical protein
MLPRIAPNEEVHVPGTRGGGEGPDRHQALVARRIHLMLAGVLLGGAALVVGISEPGGRGWDWTGFPENSDLWDWLHLLVLPFVLLLLPLWVGTHRQLRREWLVGLVTVGVAFAVIVYGGYELGWEWTGFSGNHLWDWLELLVLPFTVALLPVWLGTRRRLSRGHLAWAVVGLALFAALVACGYTVPWAWTGFEGNTLWDWIQLVIVPFAIPVAVTVLIFTAEQARESEIAREGPAAEDAAAM